MVDDRDAEATQSTTVPSRKDSDDPAAKVIEPVHDGPPEVEDAARQEVQYPEDETGEG